MKLRYRKITSIKEFIDAIRLRFDVFVKEQGFQPGFEPDEEDKAAMHFMVSESNMFLVATARVRKSQGLDEYKLERMAVRRDYRGKGVGKGLVDFILRDLARLRPKRIWLQSQVQAQRFYEKCGFKAVSKPYDLYGCPHIDMEYSKLA